MPTSNNSNTAIFFGKDLRIAQNQTNLLVTESEKLETQVKKAEQEVMFFLTSYHTFFC